ncbi:APC family permease [Fructilactobacillus lindneri]|uniref:Amino acid transporter n=1 Tax=Fructilactobacillus lindneri DSM 20690 = JCM 11027 TaxID=1122148 RepID=A0A0R2JSL0_9LACO|nr:amino acid permease [Fructilactobacillus lindneri]KRN78838.1 amino acid transporter [Fructilactobacillus lindneri DSM 20690 = JCM 11027]POH06360.1 amino acid permease [Fructilactobacillus lindneri]POH23900.1 amino acid permease [Fructilactobacillus lindneri DSM 20690 = JCM 11027]SJZ85214.1 amino acid/polyamine/organocation transporter, APC superfamily (TC 2.A.3) [Fructilactobacillus lindneri DSM 20690 = JCM 11027]
MKNIFKKMNEKVDFHFYMSKDKSLEKTMTVKDFLALGLGTILSTSIFTLPGIVAAKYTGPAVVVSFILAAVVAGLVAMNHAEMASVLPFAGSAYSWISVLFGKFWGWIVGWALLAEYLIAVAFVAAGLSSNVQGLISPLGIALPKAIASPLGTNGGVIDIIAVIVVALVTYILLRGDRQTTKISNILVVLKLLAIITFIVVGATAIKMQNYVPFFPKSHPNADGTTFGGWQGIYAGISTIFLSYIGFDSIASNSAEAKNPQKTMPRGIIGSLVIATIFFVCVSLVMVGMFKYTMYANNAEPVGWALRQGGHVIIASVVQAVAVAGMLVALIGMMMAGSRLIYSFGRDKMLPKSVGKLNKKKIPSNALWMITIAGVVLGAIFPFTFLAQLISAGTLIAFMAVSLAMYPLRKREGKSLPKAAYKEPFYPILPALGFIGSFTIFMGLDVQAKIYSAVWFLIGVIIYFAYGMKHANSDIDSPSDDEIEENL